MVNFDICSRNLKDFLKNAFLVNYSLEWNTDSYISWITVTVDIFWVAMVTCSLCCWQGYRDNCLDLVWAGVHGLGGTSLPGDAEKAGEKFYPPYGDQFVWSISSCHVMMALHRKSIFDIYFCNSHHYVSD